MMKIKMLVMLFFTLFLQVNSLKAAVIEITQINIYNSRGENKLQMDVNYDAQIDEYLNSETGAGYFSIGPNLLDFHVGYVYESFEGAGQYTSTPVGYSTEGFTFMLSEGEVAFTIRLDMYTAIDPVFLVVLEDYDQDGIWNSVDTDGDGIPGTASQEGMFQTMTFEFVGITPVPVPAAIWLFASGLFGITGFAWRRAKHIN